jgi:hypothetical protein
VDRQQKPDSTKGASLQLTACTVHQLVLSGWTDNRSRAGLARVQLEKTRNVEAGTVMTCDITEHERLQV